jgi:hypothetical protein
VGRRKGLGARALKTRSGWRVVAGGGGWCYAHEWRMRAEMARRCGCAAAASPDQRSTAGGGLTFWSARRRPPRLAAASLASAAALTALDMAETERLVHGRLASAASRCPASRTPRGGRKPALTRRAHATGVQHSVTAATVRALASGRAGLGPPSGPVAVPAGGPFRTFSRRWYEAVN